jgi:hypothetical protein
MYTRSSTKDIWSLPTSYSNGVYNFNVATKNSHIKKVLPKRQHLDDLEWYKYIYLYYL